MTEILCLKCGKWLVPKKNGVLIEVGAHYRFADLWHCTDCGTELVTGFSAECIPASSELGKTIYKAQLAMGTTVYRME